MQPFSQIDQLSILKVLLNDLHILFLHAYPFIDIVDLTSLDRDVFGLEGKSRGDFFLIGFHDNECLSVLGKLSQFPGVGLAVFEVILQVVSQLRGVFCQAHFDLGNHFRTHEVLELHHIFKGDDGLLVGEGLQGPNGSGGLSHRGQPLGHLVSEGVIFRLKGLQFLDGHAAVGGGNLTNPH